LKKNSKKQEEKRKENCGQLLGEVQEEEDKEE